VRVEAWGNYGGEQGGWQDENHGVPFSFSFLSFSFSFKGYVKFNIGGYTSNPNTCKWCLVKDLVDNYQTLDFNAGYVFFNGSQPASTNYDLYDKSSNATIRMNNSTTLALVSSWSNSSSTVWDYGAYSTDTSVTSVIITVNNLSISGSNLYANVGQLTLQTSGNNTAVSLSTTTIYVTEHWAGGSTWQSGFIGIYSNGADNTFTTCSVQLSDEGEAQGTSPGSRFIMYVNTFAQGGTQPLFINATGNGHRWTQSSSFANGRLSWYANF
jgi:hypothetical protein